MMGEFGKSILVGEWAKPSGGLAILCPFGSWSNKFSSSHFRPSKIAPQGRYFTLRTKLTRRSRLHSLSCSSLKVLRGKR